jgi:hypothetical protein
MEIAGELQQRRHGRMVALVRKDLGKHRPEVVEDAVEVMHRRCPKDEVETGVSV